MYQLYTSLRILQTVLTSDIIIVILILFHYSTVHINQKLYDFLELQNDSDILLLKKSP
jgi:hypothetical protein